MPIRLVLAIIFLVIAITLLVIQRMMKSRESSVRVWLKRAGYGLLALAVIFTGFSSVTTVSTKNVGIVTSFGRPTGSLGNGLHFKAPWEKVTELDAATQTDSYFHSQNPACIPVRIAHQATACVDTSIRWRIVQEQSDTLFRDYREFDNIRDSLVNRKLRTTLTEVFTGYDPLGIDEKTGTFTAPSSKSQSDRASSLMKTQVGSEIEVLSVDIGVVHFDDPTQKRINDLQGQVAQTRIARQSVATAEQQAAANNKLAASISQNPAVVVYRCYDLVEKMVAKDMTPPVAFNCWPGSGSSIVIPQAPANAK